MLCAFQKTALHCAVCLCVTLLLTDRRDRQDLPPRQGRKVTGDVESSSGHVAL